MIAKGTAGVSTTASQPKGPGFKFTLDLSLGTLHAHITVWAPGTPKYMHAFMKAGDSKLAVGTNVCLSDDLDKWEKMD